MKDETSYDMETMTTITALMVDRAMTRVVEVVGEGDRCDDVMVGLFYDSDFCSGGTCRLQLPRAFATAIFE